MRARRDANTPLFNPLPRSAAVCRAARRAPTSARRRAEPRDHHARPTCAPPLSERSLEEGSWDRRPCAEATGTDSPWRRSASGAFAQKWDRRPPYTEPAAPRRSARNEAPLGSNRLFTSDLQAFACNPSDQLALESDSSPHCIEAREPMAPARTRGPHCAHPAAIRILAARPSSRPELCGGPSSCSHPARSRG